MARYSVMTKIFSLSRVSLAGREFGILMGMGEPPDLAWYTGVYAHGDTPIKSYFYGNGNLGFRLVVAEARKYLPWGGKYDTIQYRNTRKEQRAMTLLLLAGIVVLAAVQLATVIYYVKLGMEQEKQV